MRAASAQSRVLVVDDDRAVAMVLSGLLRQAGYHVRTALGGNEALAVMVSGDVDVVLSDVRMPDMDGMELLAQIKKRNSDVPVVLLTAHGSVPLAVEAMKAGAADFLQKPFDKDEVVFVIGKVLTAVAREQAQPPTAPNAETRGVLGNSPALRALLEAADKVAPTQASVLLTGESGTGKEVFAQYLHAQSGRKGPLVAVHCAALPENLLESELFGYERGAFTGATQRKPGRVELAANGTLFLDEVGEIPMSIQAKLLRVVQEREFVRVGGTKAESVDVRFIAATHRNLEQRVADGLFREDLLFRLRVVPLELPPLRKRGRDLRVLAESFCQRLAQENGRPPFVFEDSAWQRLEAHAWPGNVRELANVIERLVIFSDGPTLSEVDVDREFARTQSPTREIEGDALPLDAHVHEAEKRALEDALARAAGNRSLAARLLGISRRTLYNKLSALADRG